MDMVSIHREFDASNIPANCRGLSTLAFAAWVAVVLIGFVVLSIALGVIPIDPAIFAAR
jgi:hypothetical protein